MPDGSVAGGRSELRYPRSSIQSVMPFLSNSIGSDQSSLIEATDNIGKNCQKRRAIIGLNCDFHTPKQDVEEEVSDVAQADHSEFGE